MKCQKCGFIYPEFSKYCRQCGSPMEILLPCSGCGSDNPRDSIFCTECGLKLSGVKKSVKKNQRKCKDCGQFNDLDALFCVGCGEKINRKSKKYIKKNSTNPSFQTIFIYIALFLIAIFLVKQIMTVSKEGNLSRLSSTSFSSRIPQNGVDEADVFAVAKNFICACGKCGEQPLETCTCDMPKGSVEEKNFIRKNLAQGLTVDQVIELVDEKYGYRK